jgi:hypothetical protein
LPRSIVGQSSEIAALSDRPEFAGRSTSNSQLAHVEAWACLKAVGKPQAMGGMDAGRDSRPGSRSALIIVDMQNDFLHPDGSFATTAGDLLAQ